MRVKLYIALIFGGAVMLQSDEAFLRLIALDHCWALFVPLISFLWLLEHMVIIICHSYEEIHPVLYSAKYCFLLTSCHSTL